MGPRGGKHGVVPSETPSFRDVFERDFDYVWHALGKLGVRDADRQDVAQEVFLTAHAIWHDYDATRPARPWLFGIAYRLALRHRARAMNARERLDEVPEPADDAPPADVALERAERQRLVAKAIEGIELSRRAVFLLADLDGLSMPEVTVALGIPLNTGYSRLRLAREDFRAAIARITAGRPS